MQKRYWLRWGLVIGAVSLLSSLLVVSLPTIGSTQETLLIFTAPVYIFLIPMSSNFSAPDTKDLLLISIAGAFIWFCIGSFIGWLYGKFKDRKSSSVS